MNHVRGDGSFPRKRSPDAGDGRAADHFQPSLLLAAELDPIADAGAGDPGICNGPILLQKDFGCPWKQHSFKMSPQHARLIQRFTRCDSIVARERLLADFCNNICQLRKLVTSNNVHHERKMKNALAARVTRS
jgi:hypothetical protein